MATFWRYFAFSALSSVVVLGLVLGFVGPAAMTVTMVLMAIEIAFSFDNAIINAKVLGRLSPLWQKLFLSVGIVIAIFGMRILFPLVIVALSSHLHIGEVWRLALHEPGEYAEKLEQTHTAIMAFGGAFLLMLTLHFLMDDSREVVWLRRVEHPFRRMGRWWLPACLTVLAVLALAVLPLNPHERQTLVAGLSGVAVYGAMQGFLLLVERLAGRKATAAALTGWAALATFLYLEVLDASFSFDGVIGAFAITNQVVLIAAGLGVGAVWVRSLTVFIIRRGTLDAYRFLEHGAHYAIGVLALAMFASVLWDVPELVTGVASLGLIGASVVASRQART